jgi:hypothetical protein
MSLGASSEHAQGGQNPTGFGAILAVFASIFLLFQPIIQSVQCLQMMTSGSSLVHCLPGQAAPKVASDDRSGAPTKPAMPDCCKDCNTCTGAAATALIAALLLCLLGLQSAPHRLFVASARICASAFPGLPPPPRAPPAY